MAINPNTLADLERQNRLPAGLLAAVMMQESGGNPNAISPKGASGAFQFMPATAAQYGIDPTDPEQSARAAAKMYGELLTKYNGDLPSALAGYNWGQGNVDRKGLQNAPVETRKYISSIQSRLGKGTQVADAGGMIGASNDGWEDIPQTAQYDGEWEDIPQVPQTQEQAQGEDLGAFASGVQGFNSTVPFGNRLTAGAASLASYPLAKFNNQEISLQDLYDTARANQKATAEANPNAELAGSIGGIAATLPIGFSKAISSSPIIGTAANALQKTANATGNFVRGGEVAADAGKLAKIGNLAGQSIRSAAVTAPTAALYGAGAADEGKQIEGAATGAGMGAAIGAALPAAGAALGAGALSLANIAKKGIKSTEELNNAAIQWYDAAEKLGGAIKPEGTNQIVSSILGKVGQTDELLKEAAKNIRGASNPVNDALTMIEGLKDKTLSLKQLDGIDGLLQEKISSNLLDKATVRNLKTIQNEIRTASRSVTPENLVNPQAFDAWRNGDTLYSAKMKSKQIDDIVKNAYNDKVPATGIRTGFKQLEKSINKYGKQGWTDEEIAAISNAAKSGVVGGALSTMGSRLLAGISGAGAGAMGGGMFGVPVGVAIAEGATFPIRGAANQLQRSKATQVQRLLGDRKNIQNLLKTNPSEVLQQAFQAKKSAEMAKIAEKQVPPTLALPSAEAPLISTPSGIRPMTNAEWQASIDARNNARDLGIGRTEIKTPNNINVPTSAQASVKPSPLRMTILTDFYKTQSGAVHDIELNPNFKKWFGNSKVVDEQGKPLVVYHGGSRWDKQNDGWLFASDDFTTARSYADQYNPIHNESEIKPLYLRMSNPLDFRNQKNIDKVFGENSVSNLRNGRNITQYDLMYDGDVKSKAIKYAEKNGFDGAIFQDTTSENKVGGTSYVVFNKGDAKLAKPKGYEEAEFGLYGHRLNDTGNSGRFDPNNPSISGSVKVNPALVAGGVAAGAKAMGYGSPKEEQPIDKKRLRIDIRPQRGINNKKLMGF